MFMEGFYEKLNNVNEDIRLIQNTRGLAYGTDAYLLYAYVRPKSGGIGVELGAGSGVISLLLLSKGKLSLVHAAEIQECYADMMRRNAVINRLEERLIVHWRDIREMASSDIGGTADVVFTNPPYMKADSGKSSRYDEKQIARHEVMGDISDFCSAASRLLKYGGSFYAVYRPDRLCDLICAARLSGLEIKRMTFVHSDVMHKPSSVLVEAKKGAFPGVYLTKPLIIKNILNSDSGTEYVDSPDFAYIYDNGRFKDEYERP